MFFNQRSRLAAPALLLALALLGVLWLHSLLRLHAAAVAPIVTTDRASARLDLSARGAEPYPVLPAAAPSPTSVAGSLPTRAAVTPTPTAPPTPTPTRTRTATPTAIPPTPTVTPTLRPTLPFTYTVKSGDTLWDLSITYDIDVDSIVWANERLEEDRDALSIDQVLVIPPVVGALHTVAPGDTLSTIAAFYKTTADAITGYAANNLRPPYPLQVGQVLVIPGGTKPLLTRWVSTSKGTMTVNAPSRPGRFSWPTAGYITQYFSRGHLGIDIANSPGTAIVAAADGVVIFAGEKAGGFGLAVTIDHGDGYSTQYSHLQSIGVGIGQHVAAGEHIGEMGDTGLSTGPHLDFRVYYLGGAVNPIHYLP